MGGASGGSGVGLGGRITPGDRRMILRATGDEMRERGLEGCNCWVHVLVAVLVCTVVFGVVWELT